LTNVWLANTGNPSADHAGGMATTAPLIDAIRAQIEVIAFRKPDPQAKSSIEFIGCLLSLIDRRRLGSEIVEIDTVQRGLDKMASPTPPRVYSRLQPLCKSPRHSTRKPD
jgi:hypothetical protein